MSAPTTVNLSDVLKLLQGIQQNVLDAQQKGILIQTPPAAPPDEDTADGALAALGIYVASNAANPDVTHRAIANIYKVLSYLYHDTDSGEKAPAPTPLFGTPQAVAAPAGTPDGNSGGARGGIAAFVNPTVVQPSIEAVGA